VLNPIELTPPAFQLEEKEAWLRFNPVLNAFLQLDKESTFTTCAVAHCTAPVNTTARQKLKYTFFIHQSA
jgi:hypothetical protein